MQLDDRHPNRRVTLPETPGRAARLWGDTDGNLSLGGDGGYALALVALLMIPMMVAVSFAVDLGSWYAQSTKMQRAADAASMAGDVWLPNEAAARTAAQNTARANGYTIDCNNVSVCWKVSDTDFRVSIQAPVSRFFSQVFGTPQFNMTRAATARFNKQIPMGSPANLFGNNMNVANCPSAQPASASPCGPLPMLWGAINGPYRSFDDGDPYSTKCNGSTYNMQNKAACDSGPVNPQGHNALNSLYRNTGYNYAVDVSFADRFANLTIEIYDATSSYRTADTSASGGYTGDCNANAAPFNAAPYTTTAAGWGAQQCQTGDTSGRWNPNTGATNVTPPKDVNELNMEYALYTNDGSDLSVSYVGYQTAANGGTSGQCFRRFNAGMSVSGLKNAWTTLCQFNPGGSQGIFPLKVKSSGITGVTDAGESINAFSFRVVGGASTRIYALNDMSIWSNTPGSTSRFYLAEIPPEHAGKKLLLDMYDPGDGNGSSEFYMQVRAPSAGSPAVVPGTGTQIPVAGVATSCNYNLSPSPTKGPVTPDVASTCRVRTKRTTDSSGGVYNARWLRIEIQLATNYTCNNSGVGAGDCWWTIHYDFSGAGLPTDRTVWSLTVVGDPVHLVD